MAISLVSTFGVISESGTTIPMGKSSLTQDGDVILALTYSSSTTPELSVLAPSGWTDRGQFLPNYRYSNIYYRVIANAGAEPSQYNFVRRSIGTSRSAVRLFVFRGVDTESVFANDADSDSDGGLSMTAPSIVTNKRDAAVVAIEYGHPDLPTVSVSPPMAQISSGYLGRTASGPGYGNHTVWMDEQAVMGHTGERVVTSSSSNGIQKIILTSLAPIVTAKPWSRAQIL